MIHTFWENICFYLLCLFISGFYLYTHCKSRDMTTDTVSPNKLMILERGDKPRKLYPE